MADPRRTAGKLGLDALVGSGLGKLVSHANAVEDGPAVRGAVADDAHSAHAQQNRPAVLGVVQPAAEVVEGPPREQRSHLRGDRAGKRFAQHFAHKASDSLAGLERHRSETVVWGK